MLWSVGHWSAQKPKVVVSPGPSSAFQETPVNKVSEPTLWKLALMFPFLQKMVRLYHYRKENTKLKTVYLLK